MHAPVPPTPSDLILSGHAWHLHAEDEEAARVLAALCRAMSLKQNNRTTDHDPAFPCLSIQIFTDPNLRCPVINWYEPGTACCLLPLPKENDLLVIGMMSIAMTVVRMAQARGGVLVHGALAAHPGHDGILLAGPGTVGKTTASNRLPGPWRSLSDDSTLVLPNRNGRYQAHPWPTWSRFFNNDSNEPGPGGIWNVQDRLPLRALFFLRQATENHAAPLAETPAVAALMETVQHVSWPLVRYLPLDQILPLHDEQLAAAEQIIACVPAYTLHISLTGFFWEIIDSALARDSSPPLQPKQALLPADPTPLSRPTFPCSTSHADILIISYTGSSMNPTLRHPDLVQVVSYGDNLVRVGDVICFTEPGGDSKIIHRVISIDQHGIRTCGDNNSQLDPYCLQQEDIIGRVTVAWRNGQARVIVGGCQGKWSRRLARLRVSLDRILSPLLHDLYQALAQTGLGRTMFPTAFRPRVVVFQQRYLPPVLKLIAHKRVIGRFDNRQKQWQIERPWRLFIDAAALPRPEGCGSKQQTGPVDPLTADGQALLQRDQETG